MRSHWTFATDAALGKLARHLRATGFDTRCAHQYIGGPLDFWAGLEAERVILTRTRALRRRFASRRLIFIQENDPWLQFRQVVERIGADWHSFTFLSRCLACNTSITPVAKERVRGQVPDYTWQCHGYFSQCGCCQRIYWAGSHYQRMAQRMETLFTREGRKRS